MHYNDKVTLLANEQFFEKENGDAEKRITDCRIMIKRHIYHIECQSRPDSTIEIRMIEYDFHIALAEREKMNGEQVLRFPETAVLYLRHTRNTPDKLYVKIIFPDDQEVRYSVPIVKVQEYTKEDILNKQLFFFTPYYILKFEKELERIDGDEEKIKKLTEDYQEIYEQLRILENQKVVSSTYLYNLIVLTERLVKIVADKQTNIKREVSTMGGRVLELESDKIMERGREEIRKQIAEKLLKKGNTIETIMDITDLTEEEIKEIEENMLLSP